MPLNTLFTYRIEDSGEELLNAENRLWERCERATIDRYWDGKPALREKGHNWNNLTRIASFWNKNSVFFNFECWFDRLNINAQWSARSATPRLRETDVVEVFLKPESCDDYFEIEVSPLGEYLDAHVIKPRVDVDFRWNSGLRTKVRINEKKRIWHALFSLPFQPIIEASSLAELPEVGAAWRLNLYRIAGEGAEREYLAWRPTFTRQPDFHVSSAFGNLIFLD